MLDLPANATQLQPWSFISGETQLDCRPNAAGVPGIEEAIIKKLLAAMTNLSNHILANEASRELVK